MKVVNNKILKQSGLLLLICLIGIKAFSQEKVSKSISIKQLFELTVANNTSLALSKSEVAIAAQQVEESKNDRLPELNTSLNGMYIGNAHLIEKDFSQSTKITTPHFGNTFSIEASQLIWKGGLVKKSIQAKSLQEEMAGLGYLATEQNIKLLVLGYYLDLYKMYNQAEVYRKNIELAEQRYDNITKFYEEGMVTRNDLIRGELQISNLKLALEVLENNAAIYNEQLIVALGLDEHTVLVPDEEVLLEKHHVTGLNNYLFNLNNHPNLLATNKNIELSELAAESTKSSRMPTLSAFAGNSLQRPVAAQSPALDMYSNGWQAGLSLSFNMSSIYKMPAVLKRNKLEIERAKINAFDTKQMLSTAVKAAYIKYNEGVYQSNALKTNTNLAEENYRIMDKKYSNQLAILLDLIDASNAKLDAELQYTNSEINILYSYYKLLRESGQL